MLAGSAVASPRSRASFSWPVYSGRAARAHLRRPAPPDHPGSALFGRFELNVDHLANSQVAWVVRVSFTTARGGFRLRSRAQPDNLHSGFDRAGISIELWIMNQYPLRCCFPLCQSDEFTSQISIFLRAGHPKEGPYIKFSEGCCSKDCFE